MRVVHPLGSVVVIACPPRFDDAFVSSLATEFDVIFAGSSRFTVITDTSRIVDLPDAKMRKLLADWMNRDSVRKHQERLNVGSSTVLRNAAMRAIVTALYWLWTPPTPQHAARDTDEALDWCVARLRDANVPLGMDEATIRARLPSLPIRGQSEFPRAGC